MRLKAAVLAGPLLVMILALHAWGDGAAGGLGRRVDSWQYPEQSVPPFLIRLPRRISTDKWPAETLTKFVDDSVHAYGATLGLKSPLLPVHVILLDPETNLRRFGGDAAQHLQVNEALFDPGPRAIVVRMERTIQMDKVPGAMRRAAARLLLQDAGSARWSPWLAEGLVGLLEGTREADLKSWSESLPTLGELLAAPASEFQIPAFARAARLLVAYLWATLPDEFVAYYRTSRDQGAVPLARSVERFGIPNLEPGGWRDWMQAQK